jgi:hypothetical protein
VLDYIGEKDEKESKQLKENIKKAITETKNKQLEAQLTANLPQKIVAELTDTPARTLRKRREPKQPWVKKPRKANLKFEVCNSSKC